MGATVEGGHGRVTLMSLFGSNIAVTMPTRMPEAQLLGRETLEQKFRAAIYKAHHRRRDKHHISGRLMTDHRQLSQGPLGPPEIETLTSAYDLALAALHMPDRHHPITELIAAKIIQVYRLGEHMPRRLSERAITELGIFAGRQGQKHEITRKPQRILVGH